MNRRDYMRRKNRAKYGLYNIPEYHPRKKKKKKKQIKPANIIRLLIIFLIFFVLFYIVIFFVKLSMKRKGIKLYKSGDYSSAIVLLEEALNPRLPLMGGIDTDSRMYLADCFVNIGRYDEACYEYSQIRIWEGEESDKCKELHDIAIGLLRYSWKDYSGALPVLLRAYEQGHTDLVLYVGSCYGQMGNNEKMQEYYDVFLRNNSMNSFMYAQYAAIALDAGDLDGAKRYIDEGLKLDDKSNERELMFDEIIYYEKLKDYNSAFSKAAAFIEKYPTDAGGKQEYDLLYTRHTIEE